MTDEHVKRLERMLKEKERQLAATRNAIEIYAKEKQDLRQCLEWFVSDSREMSLEKAIKSSKAVLRGKGL